MANNNHIEYASYLLDENFSHSRSYMAEEIILSGWEVDTAGGYFDYAEEDWFKVVHANTDAPVIMKKDFLKQANGKITMEP